MIIQRHVRRDFQPVYLKIESLEELVTLFDLLSSPEAHTQVNCIDMKHRICPELAKIIEDKGLI